MAEGRDDRVGVVRQVLERAEVRLAVPEVALVVHRPGEVEDHGDVSRAVRGHGGGHDRRDCRPAVAPPSTAKKVFLTARWTVTLTRL